MQKTRFSQALSLILCTVLIAATALLTSGCNDKTTGTADTSSIVASQVEAATSSQENVVGTGKTQFLFTVTDLDGKETNFTINTDQTTVGAALVEAGLIAGEDSDYGLYVKTVNGTTLDYNTDGKYWAFYVNGEYATAGVDSTDIEAGATYTFKAE